MTGENVVMAPIEGGPLDGDRAYFSGHPPVVLIYPSETLVYGHRYDLCPVHRAYTYAETIDFAMEDANA